MARACSTRSPATAAERPAELRELDHEREITPDWLQREQAVGYVAYVDRFAGTLAGVRERLPYLRELGVSYLHLMPLLHARPEPNDGGYAVVDYGAVEPALGTMDDLRALAAELRAHGMALCIDLVLNHTAREHPWARRATATRERASTARSADRAEPDAYERTLPEVFPDIAPGNFTWSERLDRWVWTTFNAYQWDLDYTNPDGVRRDGRGDARAGGGRRRRAAPGRRAVPVEAAGHQLPEPARGPRCSCRRSARSCGSPRRRWRSRPRRSSRRATSSPTSAPGRHEGKECDLAYHNVLMVLLWSALAAGRVHLLTHTLLADAAACRPAPAG